MSTSPSQRRHAAAIFFVVFALHAVSPVKTCFDSQWSVPTVLSVLREHNFDLDEYRPTPITHGVLTVEGHLVTYPLGVVLLALPCVAVFDGLVRAVRPLLGSVPVLSRAAERWLSHADGTGRIDLSFFDTAEMIIASLIVAAAAAVLFTLARRRLEFWPALLLVFTFAFATSAWSTASRALWQHGPSMLMLSWALAWLLRAKERASFAGWAGLPLALAYVCRPTNAIPLAVFATWVLVRHRGQVLRFAASSGAVLLAFFALNWSIYGAPLSPYYLPQHAGEDFHFWSGVAGALFSPSRGLFVFTPVFLFSLWGAALAWRDGSLDGLEKWVLAAVLLHLLMLGRFWCWWGGHCYGPRLFSDLVPLWVVLLVPVVSHLSAAAPGRRTTALRAAFALALMLSVAIHFRGATTWAVYYWNSFPPASEERVWDWGDPQFLR